MVAVETASLLADSDSKRAAEHRARAEALLASLGARLPPDPAAANASPAGARSS